MARTHDSEIAQDCKSTLSDALEDFLARLGSSEQSICDRSSWGEQHVVILGVVTFGVPGPFWGRGEEAQLEQLLLDDKKL